MLLEAIGIKKDYGGESVLDGASFSISEGEKVGLVGRNGAGKSTLLRILCGEDDDYKGTVRRRHQLRIAMVGQYFPDFDGTAREFLGQDVLALRDRLRELEAAMGDPVGADAALREYGILRERYDALDGDAVEDRADRLLDSMGLAGAADKHATALSGGERNALALAAGILAKPDLLVLDEPGNHLDLWGLAWLERYLAGIPQAVLLVSHNRYLLDRTVGRIVELDGGRSVSFVGGWSAYRMEKLRLSASQGLDYNADRKKLERLEALVKRFEQIARSRPDPAWGKRLRAKRSQLERARSEAVEKPTDDGPRIEARFTTSSSKADIAVSVRAYSAGYPGRRLFRDAELLIRVGERVGLVGPNGCGKTTFLRDLVRNGSWDHPSLRVGPSLRLGWCAQDQELFDPSRTILEEFQRLGPLSEDAVFGAVRPFLFSRADLAKRIGDLSGGERNRLQLARAVVIGADFLVLDEPTNHLDVAAREAVEDALADFGGTLLVVSHDRYFLDRTVERIVEIDGEGGFRSWDGNFSEFWFRAYGEGGARPGRSRPAELESRGAELARDRARSEGAASAPPSSARRPSAGRGAELARRIERMEAERKTLESAAATALGKGDYRESRRLGNELASLSKKLDRLYLDWLQAEA